MSSINTNYWPTMCESSNGRCESPEHILEYNSTWYVPVDQLKRHLCTQIAILICQQQLLQLLIRLFPIPVYVCNSLLFRIPYLVIRYIVVKPFLHQILEILYFASGVVASHRVVPRGFHVIFADSRRREPTRLRLEPIRLESGRLGPESAVSVEMADSNRNSKKKKKGAERTI